MDRQKLAEWLVEYMADHIEMGDGEINWNPYSFADDLISFFETQRGGM